MIPYCGVLLSVVLCPGSECEDRATPASSLSVDTRCYPWYFRLASGAGVPRRSKSLPSTCPGPHACCTCPSLHLEPRWSLPGQLSCLPHGSVAPRTGPQENPAGQGASKQGSSWAAWGHWGWVRWSFREDLESLYTCGAGLGLQGQELEEDSLK